MERIFRVKVKSDPDIFNQYPSERRYSASIVLGLSAVLVQLSLCAILMGALIVHKMFILADNDASTNQSDVEYSRLAQKLIRDMELRDQNYLHYYISVPALVAAACFLMSFGNVIAFVVGLFAWKRWYIDHNITFFFLGCCVSTITSGSCFIASIITSSDIDFDSEFVDNSSGKVPPLTLSLAVNVIVLALLSTIWSAMAAKVAYNGMRNSYPNDISDRGRRVQTSTVRSGNSLNNIPAEVFNSFAIGTVAKYLPKKENNDLPKQESRDEYHQRVNQFLNGQPDEEIVAGDQKVPSDKK